MSDEPYDLAFDVEQPHNHVTRDIKRVGQCPGCDEFWGLTYAPQKADQKYRRAKRGARA
jgi:hypothetical protein